jgi:nucleoside-diphosphate-sugar epimerase
MNDSLINHLNNKKILITGCAGFIGYHLTKYLLNFTNSKITGIDNFSRGSNDGMFKKLINNSHFTFFEFDLAIQSNYIDLEKEYDIIFNLATINGTQNFYHVPFDVLVSAALPTLNLINHFRETSLSLFVQAGTPESYAPTILKYGGPLPTPENVDLVFPGDFSARYSYGVSKSFADWALFSANKQFSFPFITLRYHNVFGPRMGDKHFVPDMINKIRSGNPRIDVLGANETRSFLYIDDAIILTALTTIYTMTKNNRNKIFNIGSAEEMKISSATNIIMNEMKSDKNILKSKSFTDSVHRRIPDIRLQNKVTKYRPYYNFQLGIQKMISEKVAD